MHVSVKVPNATKLKGPFKNEYNRNLCVMCILLQLNVLSLKSEHEFAFPWNRPTGCMTEETAPPSVDFGGGT